MTDINVSKCNDSDENIYISIDGVLFEDDGGSLILYPEGRQGAYIVPDSVTSISKGAFANCTGLVSIVIPETVIRIEKRAFAHCTGLIRVNIPDSVMLIERCSFAGCTLLTSIIVPDGSKRNLYELEDHEGNWLYDDCILLPIRDISSQVFGSCYKLTIYAPIGSWANEYAKIMNIKFDEL